MAITDPNDGKLSEIFHFLLIGFCFYRFPGGPQLVIEQLEQIRNLSAATDNSITSDQKIEEREKSENFLWNGKHISSFFKFGKSFSFQPKIGKIRDKFSQVGCKIWRWEGYIEWSMMTLADFPAVFFYHIIYILYIFSWNKWKSKYK